MKKYTLILILFLGLLNYGFGQKAIISQPAMNVFYIGILNEIHIGLEGYKSKDIIKEISSGEFIEKEGKTFVKVSKRGEAWIKIGIRKNNQNMWKDSLEFRVRELPKPIPQMGTMQDGAVESVGTIRANASRIFMSLGSGFSVEGIRCKVLSFRISVVGSMGFVSENIEGSSINGNAQKFLQSLQNGSEIFIDDISYNVVYQNDTIIKNVKSNETVKIKARSGNNNPYILGFNDDNYPTYRWSYYDTNFFEKELKDFSIKGSFLETDEIFDSENIKNQTSYITHYSNFTKNGLWVYSIGKTPSQIYKEEFYDSGKLTAYHAYDSTGFKIIDLKIPKNSDSVYYIEKYANGKTKREGWVIIKLAEDYKYEGQDHSGERCGNFDENGSETFFRYFDFMPISSWKEYHKNRKLKLDANFIKVKDNVTYSFLSDEPHITKGYTIFYDGLWKKYDENGKLIQDFLYQKGINKKANKY